MKYQTLDELKDFFVRIVAQGMLEGCLQTGWGQNANYYWRWWGYVETAELTELFPDIEERAKAPIEFKGTEVFTPSADEAERVYAYQLEKWYDVDFTEARKQVWERYDSKREDALALFRA